NENENPGDASSGDQRQIHKSRTDSIWIASTKQCCELFLPQSFCLCHPSWPKCTLSRIKVVHSLARRRAKALALGACVGTGLAPAIPAPAIPLFLAQLFPHQMKGGRPLRAPTTWPGL
ncbi:hypothetical protein KUCAC02_001350, partial [Chaenocephalus aceratus]